MDYEHSAEEISRAYSINTKNTTSLRDILPLLKKKILLILATNYRVSGRFHMNKSELCEALFLAITDKINLEEILLIARPSEWCLFLRLINQHSVRDSTLDSDAYLYLHSQALIFIFCQDGIISFLIPDEVKRIYSKIDTPSFHARRERFAMICKYLSAMSNLYGIFTDFLCSNTFITQNPGQHELGVLEYLTTFNLLTWRPQPFRRIGISSFGSSYFRNMPIEELNAFQDLARNLPFYPLEKDELLKYADSAYHEATPQSEALLNFIIGTLNVDLEMARGILEDIRIECLTGSNFDSPLREFERRHLIPQTQALKDILESLIIDFYNSTRQWKYHGYTPSEMNRLFGLKDAVLPRPFLHIEEVGRNNPCPCGSGKKYKKCCGLNQD